MRLVFAAGDVGGARALLPVARLAAHQGLDVAALAQGVFRKEGGKHWHWFEPADAAEKVKTADVVLYATSVRDQCAVEVAASARAAGKPVLHLLDNWSNYATRIAALVPDAYAVMDELAVDEAVAAGVPREILVVTGHPDIAKLVRESKLFAGAGEGDHIRRLLFVSEPAAADGGKAGRGYDEIDVARALIEGITLTAAQNTSITLNIAPHPRENRAAVDARFRTLCANLPSMSEVNIIAPDAVRWALHTASHVAGMSSILLYESWLLGRPTLSLQPGLIGSGLRTLGLREGVIFHNSREDTAAAVAKWLALEPRDPLPELSQHENAAQEVIDLASKLASRQR